MLEKTEPIRNDEAASPEDLAAEFIDKRSAGEPAYESAFLGRLASDAAREEFKALIAAAGCAERGLPRTVTGGTLLAGRYRILEPIGGGGMGRVFAAVDEKLGCRIAVKLLEPLSQGNREREELFQKESRVLAELKHPGIVAVHDAGRDGAYTYIVMDLVLGTSLGDVLDKARSQLVLGARGNKLPPRDGALLTRAIGRPVQDGRSDLIEPRDWYRSCGRILLEVSRTLEAAHGKKVVHRDLKPANVMILGGGNPVVLDFGLAGSPELSTGAVTEALYGSVCYLAPEQARSQKVGMDPRTDVYQLGLLLYEMLTLRRAFPGNAIGEVLQKIEAGFYELPRKVDPRIPRDLEAICTMALEVSPERRYSGAREMREDLERWLEGRAPIASRTARWRSLARTTRYTARRHPVMAAAAAVVLAVGLGSFWWGGGEVAAPSMRPVRYDGLAMTRLLLPPRGATVLQNQWLGVNVQSTREVYVYSLSVYGPDKEERFASPWRTATPEDPHRNDRKEESFGLRVPAEDVEKGRDLLSAEVTSQPQEFEGLLVYASPVERPDIEAWMRTLEQIEVKQGPMRYAKALDLYRNQHETILRGAPVKVAQTDDEYERTMAGLASFGIAKGSPGSPMLELPGEGWCAVECRVAPK
jgi:serine/threonine protein kinase